MSLVNKILKEADVMDSKIKNPKTGREIKVSSALGYDDSEPVKKKALSMIHKGSGTKEVKPTVKQQPKEKEKNSRSHKPTSQSFGVSKECVAFLKEKGYTDLSVLPQSFVSKEQIQFNPELETKGDANTWVCKFPSKDKSGKEIIKTAYTKSFMKKSQEVKYAKISKIKEEDIVSIEKKTKKLLGSSQRSVADSACVLGIILKTGLRIGSEDKADSGNVGVRTLSKKNIDVQGDTVKLNFIGKSYQENTAVFKDKNIAAYLKTILNSSSDDEKVFKCSYKRVGEVMQAINPKAINPKDLRTYKATKTAKDLLQDSSIGNLPPIPKDEKEIKNAVKEKLKIVFDKVSQVLNNTPTMARSSYVHPVVITDFLDSLGLEPKHVGYTHVTLEAKQPKQAIRFTSMDEMFEKYPPANVKGIDIYAEEEMEECEEYPIPEWWYDDSIQIVKKNKTNSLSEKILKEAEDDFFKPRKVEGREKNLYTPEQKERFKNFMSTVGEHSSVGEAFKKNFPYKIGLKSKPEVAEDIFLKEHLEEVCDKIDCIFAPYYWIERLWLNSQSTIGLYFYNYEQNNITQITLGFKNRKEYLNYKNELSK